MLLITATLTMGKGESVVDILNRVVYNGVREVRARGMCNYFH